MKLKSFYSIKTYICVFSFCQYNQNWHWTDSHSLILVQFRTLFQVCQAVSLKQSSAFQTPHSGWSHSTLQMPVVLSYPVLPFRRKKWFTIFKVTLKNGKYVEGVLVFATENSVAIHGKGGSNLICAWLVELGKEWKQRGKKAAWLWRPANACGDQDANTVIRTWRGTQNMCFPT